MPHPTDPSRDLLFGLLALQNGLIDQVQLVAAFQAWTRDKARALADHLIALGHLDGAQKAAVEAMAVLHVAKHGDVRRSLAAIPAGRSTRESLARLGDPDLGGTLARVRPRSTEQYGEADADRTATYRVGSATGDGQRFRVLRPHARGGLGAVFVALDTDLHREVALKQILDDHADDPDSRQRFLLEAEVTGGLEHPGIVPVYGLGTYGDGRPYYAMRFIRGDSLKEAIEHFHADRAARNDPGKGSLELRQLLRRFTDVCNAIEYAHSRGVLHRDLKPGNVIVGRHGETLVVDWGLAKLTGTPDPSSGETALRPGSASGSAGTLAGSALGTPAYMSPEQAEGDIEHLGPRSDVYSLGATLYYVLTGRPPFVGDAIDVMPAVRKGEFPPPRLVDPTIDRALEAVCLKAMASRPEDRYGSCRALVEDIERWMADEPVGARRDPVIVRARRWARRNRTVVAGGAAALLAGLIGLAAVATVQARSNSALEAKNVQLTAANAAATRAKDDAEKALAETARAKRATEEALAQSEASRRRAEAAEKTARSEADKAKAVNDFLTQDLLIQADPDYNPVDDKVTVKELLDRASGAVATRFTGRPRVEAAVRTTIARAYHGLGAFARAEPHERAALEILRREPGPEALETLIAMRSLAHTLTHLNRSAEAEPLLRAALDGLRRLRGPDDQETLTGMSMLAGLLEHMGQYAEAERLLRPTVEGFRRTMGPGYDDTLSNLNNLGLALRFQGKLAEAEAVYREVLSARMSRFGPDHPGTLTTTHNLAMVLYQQDRLAEAEELFRRALEGGRRVEGAEHRNTLTKIHNLGMVLQRRGKLAEAEPLFRVALERRRQVFGSDHPETLGAMHILAHLIARRSRPAEAEPLFREAREGYLRRLGPDHALTADLARDLGGVLVVLGRPTEAVPPLRAALAWRRTAGRDDPINLAGDLATLGLALSRAGRPAEAEPFLRECLMIRTKRAPDDWSRFNAMSLVGAASLGQARYAEAEPLIVPGYEGLKAREDRIPIPSQPCLPEAAERVVRLYEAWGKPEQAARWKVKLGLANLPADVFARP